MRAVTPAPGAPRAPIARGRWIWALSGVVTIGLLAIPTVGFLLGTSSGPALSAQPQHIAMQTVTIGQPVTSVDMETYGASALVATGPVHSVQVTETIAYDSQDARPPAVTDSVAAGRLTLAAPACAASNCTVGLTVIVPAPGDVAVIAQSDGGTVTITGIGQANVNSDGGPVRATGIRGPLTVATEGGTLTLNGVRGPLRADTGGGSLTAQDMGRAATSVTTDGGNADIEFAAAPANASVSTGGGGAQLEFAVPPQAVTLNTDGGPALVTVPGGPYALTTGTGGGPQIIAIATDPGAARSISVTTDGGPLQIAPSN